MQRDSRRMRANARTAYDNARPQRRPDAAACSVHVRRMSPPQRRQPQTNASAYRRPTAPATPHHPRRSPRSAATAFVALALVGAVGVAGLFSLLASQGALPAADAAAKGASENAQSTPKTQWVQGSVPSLYQTDPAWANTRYADNSFGESGCGPTCMSMVYIALTGASDKDPAAMAALATEGGYAGPDGTAWLFMTEGAASLGLRATEVPADEQSLRRALVAGQPVICSMGPGDFTELGHFIVVTGIDRNSKLIVRDPNSPERSAKTWDFATILGQCRALWSYSLV